MTPKHINALAWAVQQAEQWRGSLTGDPDPSALEEFDAGLALASEAVALLRHDRRQRLKARRLTPVKG